MKKIFFFKIVFMLLICVCMHGLTNAQDVNFIDIDKYKNSWPRNNEFSAKNAYAYLNGYSYFTADDGKHGRELWKTNGTPAGTKLVKDVNPGSASSDYDYSVYNIKASGGKIYFAADGGAGYQGLWVSDGTSNGTQFVTDVTGHGVLPTYLTDVNGKLFFAVSYYDSSFQYVNQIWATDGSPDSTSLIADLGPYGYNLKQLKNVNGRLFFTFYSFYYGGNELWTSDGTYFGTYMVADINPFGDSNPLQLTALNGLLYFIAYDGYQSKLWISDGSTAGTYPVNDSGISCYATSDDYNTDTFAIVNNVLYLQGSTADNGNELCKYDPSNPAAGVVMVKDIAPGFNSSYPSFMTNVDGTLFFTIGPAGQDAELWKSDGTNAGTKLVKDINPSGNNFYYGLTNLNGELVFAFGDNASGFDLWKSNGNAAGTKIIKDINPGIYSSFPQYLTVSDGLLLFGANDGVNGYELWKSDGTTSGTTMIKDINYTSSTSSDPHGFTAMGDKVLFSASEEQHGTELWSTDGTASGTSLVNDIYKGVFSSNPLFLISFKNKVYFFASDSTGFRLWKSNGTEAGTKMIPADWDNINAYLITMLAGKSLFYAIDYNINNQVYEIWRSDGTTAGTYIVKSDIPPYYSVNAVVIGDVLYFTSDDFTGSYGPELYKSDGTVAGTTIVKDINAGSGGSYPYQLFNFKNKLYFKASNEYGGPFLWTSDGTDAGTQPVKYILVDYTPFAQANGKLFFGGTNSINRGHELFATDGTSSGTKLVKDITKGPYSSNISSIINGDTLLYFIADDGKHGLELWSSNGTEDGTHLVKDITPGIGSTNPTSMVNINDRLFFVINDTLWQSDGTKKGTDKVKDANLTGASNISNLTAIGDKLYFSAYNYSIGQELFVMPVSPNLTSAENASAVAKTSDAFEAKLLTNPVSDQLRFSVNAKARQAVQIIITDASGRTIKMEKQTLSSNTNIFSYNVGPWSSGIYMIRIVGENGSSSLLKAVKQ